MFCNLPKILNAFLILFTVFFLNSCGGFKLPGGDARKIPVSGEERARKNVEEGRGFSLNKSLKETSRRGTNFEFASSNELWRATLEVIDFMPLTSANYSGGILITDWYSDGSNQKESIKINIRFLSNEIRADALNVDIFYKTCDDNLNCSVEKKDSDLQQELIKEILKVATKYKINQQNENFVPYPKTIDND